MAKSEDFGAFKIHNFMIEWHHEFNRDGNMKLTPVHEAFKCCPNEPENCCGHMDEVSFKFCDNWGSEDSNCPASPWNCYVFDLEEQLKSGGVSASELHVGDISTAWWGFASGLAMLLLGSFVVYITAVRYCWWKCSHLGSLEMNRYQASSLENMAAIKIQRAFRRYVVCKSLHKCMSMDSIQDVGQWERQTAEMIGRLLVLGEPIDVNWLPSAGEESEPPPARRLLYDTGNVGSFRRMVLSRTTGTPWRIDKERIEVELHDKAPPLDVVVILRRGAKLPVIWTVGRSSAVSHPSLRRGLELLQVGDVKWPLATGPQLLEALRQKITSKQIIVVFEGPPAPVSLLRGPRLPPPGPPPYLPSMLDPLDPPGLLDGFGESPPILSICAGADMPPAPMEVYALPLAGLDVKASGNICQAGTSSAAARRRRPMSAPEGGGPQSRKLARDAEEAEGTPPAPRLRRIASASSVPSQSARSSSPAAGRVVILRTTLPTSQSSSAASAGDVPASRPSSAGTLRAPFGARPPMRLASGPLPGAGSESSRGSHPSNASSLFGPQGRRETNRGSRPSSAGSLSGRRHESSHRSSRPQTSAALR